MSTFYLTPTAISDLTLLIFAGFITIYLTYQTWHTWEKQPALSLSKRSVLSLSKRPFQTLFITLTYIFLSGYILLDFLNQTLYPDLSYWFLPLQSVAITFGMVWLVQFAYRMPALYPERRRESRIVFGITLLLPLWEIGYAVYRYTALLEGEILYRPPNVDFVLVAVFIWLLLLLLRQIGYADARTIPLWRKLWKPANHNARAVRRMAFVTLLPVALTAVLLLQSKTNLPTSIASVLLSIGLLLTMLLFALVYLNYLPEQTTFMLRLSAITLAFFLAVLATVGQVMTPSFVAAYNNYDLITAPQTIRFTPNIEGGYDVAQIPYDYEEEVGKQLAYGGKAYVSLPLNFEFPFYNQNWSDLFMNKNGMVTFGKVPDLNDTQSHYGSVPSIYLMGTDLENTNATEYMKGLYAHSTLNKLTLTWLNMSEGRFPDRSYTLQMQLYDSGIFDLTVTELPATIQYNIDDRWRTARLLGVLPGTTDTPEYIRFNEDLPWSGWANGTIEDYHLDFRTALHNFLAPLFWLTLFTSLLVPLGLTLALRQNVVRPLHDILTGVRQINTGNLDIAIPIHVEDEFGYLAHTFNRMAVRMNTLIVDLEELVTERTAQLTERTTQLTDTTAYLNNILRNASDYAIVTVDRDLHITYINPMAETLYDITAVSAMGQHVSIIPPRKVDPEQFRAGLHNASTHGIHQYIITQKMPDETRHIAARLSGMFDEQGELIGYAHFSRDISERMHTESQLLSQQRAIAILEERAQIGQELHDQLGQIFAFLSLQSQTAQALFANNKREDGDRALARLAVVAQDAHSQVREFILGMRGNTTGVQDFWNTLQLYTDKLQHLYQMQITLNLPPAQMRLLPPDKELHLLRLIQEALSNARRHSGTNQAQVSFWQDGAMMRVTITDAGRGFIPPPFPASHRPFSEAQELSQLNLPDMLDENGRDHYGLLGMYEHTAALGGTLQIHAQPGEGVQIILTFSPETKMADDAVSLTGLTNLRILLVDDQPIFLEGLHNLLTTYGLQVVGMASDGLQAQELARTTHPDVIVMDIHMPICDGITATRKIKREFPGIDIVMLSVSAEEEMLFEALQAGASGYLLKSMQAKEFFLFLTGLADGIPPLDPRLAGKVLAEFRNRLQTEVTLTDEQSRLLSLIAQGRTYLQISLELNISERTVKRQMKKILQLLHLGSRTEAEAYARRRGL